MAQSNESSERRRFIRLELPNPAVAIDETGHELGWITEAGGGGMNIHLTPEAASLPLEPGLRMRITVMEPGSSNTHSFQVEIRYRHADDIGVEFL
jgi:hypothetical protein